MSENQPVWSVRRSAGMRSVGRAAGRRFRAGVARAAILLCVPLPVAARQFDVTPCLSVSSADLCRAVGEMAALITVRSAAIAIAGNPVAGTASTLGRRMPGMPRLAFTVRHTRGSADLPAGAGGSGTSMTAWSGDVTMGLFDGFSPFPTVGGMFSVDLLGSVSVVQFPSADGFRTRAPSSFGLGARLGILRESFTLPGVSLSATYRRTGRVSFGDIDLMTRDFHVRLDRIATWSGRGVVGKRIGALDFTAGAGWDRHTGRGVYRVPNSALVPVPLGFGDLEAERRLVFAGASWTLLVFNLSGELGWQFDEDGEGVAGDGGLFGGLAFRVTF